MEEYEMLKKYFIEKEKENIKLKEELDSLKSKINLNIEANSAKKDLNVSTNYYDSKSLLTDNFSTDERSNQIRPVTNYRRDSNFNKDIQNKSEIKRSKSEIGREIIISADNSVDTPMSKNILTSQNIKNNLMDFGKLIDDKNKTPFHSSSNLINLNKGISELKKHLNNYGNAYEDINSKLEKKDNTNVEMFNNQNISQFTSNTKSNKDEIEKLKEYYENVLKQRNESYVQNISIMNKTHQEEIRKLRIDYEQKIEDIIKKNEEEKLQLNRTKNCDYSLDNSILVDFQKQYLNEMKDLQSSFEAFREKTYEEFQILNKAKEDAYSRGNFYKENFNIYRNKYEKAKLLINNTENLSHQLDKSKLEINNLKNKITKLENFERAVQVLLNPNSAETKVSPNTKNIQVDLNYLTECGEISSNISKLNLFSNRSSDMVNYEMFSHNRSDNILSPINTRKFGSDESNQNEFDNNFLNENLCPKFSNCNGTLEENLSKAIDLKKAHNKIKEMENCLKSMNDENDNLKGKLGHVISNLSTPAHSEYYFQPNQKFSTGPGTNTNKNSVLTSRNKKNQIFSEFEDNMSNFRNTNLNKSKNEKDKSCDSYKKPSKEINLTKNINIPTDKSIVYNQSMKDMIRCSDFKSNEAEMETTEDNIYEFPLQLKIKGKIKKISTHSGKKNK